MKRPPHTHNPPKKPPCELINCFKCPKFDAAINNLIGPHISSMGYQAQGLTYAGKQVQLVPFNSILFDNTNGFIAAGAIELSPQTGYDVFMIQGPSIWEVNYQIGIESVVTTGTFPGIEFIINPIVSQGAITNLGTQYSPSYGEITPTVITGSAILNLTATTNNVLLNALGSEIVLTNNAVQTNIVFTRIA